ncbi:TetR/AcrR family transcriptional regulator [Actinocrispum wychmicini]|uniref:TetR family transcriptional regulator n=1 Tax=Actinocrispum wychmicini TaxID=1213861 RepID=A0A4R2IQZ0_9PSEU|nr:TetR/AcrR family transcriptional regulator [Actinocrispum wychmicini]TCO47367.1 TetR family transcriptional regulator [Actinocrispum wychmicini]
MRSKNDPRSRRRSPTFIEEARRRQIVASAITTIAGSGLAQSSLARIADEVGISKSVISYHFAGKDELIAEVITSLLSESNRVIKSWVDRAPDPTAKLRAYIEGSFAFMIEHRANFVALVDIWGSFGTVEAKRAFNAAAYEPCRRHIESILRKGQDTGEFRQFDRRTLSAVIQGAIDGVMLQWVFEERAVDLADCMAELISMVTMATRTFE